jgi:hypothetical protein
MNAWEPVTNGLQEAGSWLSEKTTNAGNAISNWWADVTTTTPEEQKERDARIARMEKDRAERDARMGADMKDMPMLIPGGGAAKLGTSIISKIVPKIVEKFAPTAIEGAAKLAGSEAGSAGIGSILGLGGATAAGLGVAIKWDDITQSFETFKVDFKKNWNSFWSFDLGDSISKAWFIIKNKATNIMKGVTAAFENERVYVMRVWSEMWDSIKGAITDAVIKPINGFFYNLNTLPKIDVFGKQVGFNIPYIPELAAGGVVTRDTVARVGERNKKEGVIPLESPNALRMIAKAIMSEMQPQAGAPTYLQVGTLIGDDRSITELERRLNSVRIKESIRKGTI